MKMVALTRPMAPLSLLALIGMGVVAAPLPAQSQAKKISQIIVFGDDPCPRSTDDEVYVCARRPAEERYRIPETLRKPATPQLGQSWAIRSQDLVNMGATGIGSCSAVGPGGWIGCSRKEIAKGNDDAAQTYVDNNVPPKK